MKTLIFTREFVFWMRTLRVKTTVINSTSNLHAILRKIVILKHETAVVVNGVFLLRGDKSCFTYGYFSTIALKLRSNFPLGTVRVDVRETHQSITYFYPVHLAYCSVTILIILIRKTKAIATSLLLRVSVIQSILRVKDYHVPLLVLRTLACIHEIIIELTLSGYSSCRQWPAFGSITSSK